MGCEKFTLRPECAKCGFDRVDLRYRGERVATIGQEMGNLVGPDLHDVKCERCGYVWYMLPKDSVLSADEAFSVGVRVATRGS